MKKYMFIVLFVGVCLGQKTLVSAKGKDLDENLFHYDSKEWVIQIGSIGDFVLNQGYPLKKQSVFGEMIIQQGRLDEFILNQGYPIKRSLDSIGSNFKIIVNYIPRFILKFHITGMSRPYPSKI